MLCPYCNAVLPAGATSCAVCSNTVMGSAMVPASPPAYPVAAPVPPTSNTTPPIGTLVCLAGPDAGKQLPLYSQTSVMIGRDTGCDFVLTDDRSSRRHARLDWQNNVFVLVDLNSSNGTKVNYQPVTTPRPLQPGDRILIGSSVIELQIAPAARAMMPAGAPMSMAGQAPPPPVLEGRIEFIDGPHMERGDMRGPAAIAIAGALINPVLGIAGGLMASQKAHIPVRYLRILDRASGNIRSAKMCGEPSGLVSVGDQVQLWGYGTPGGSLDVTGVFNQTTNEMIMLKT